ncbi:hypothetical protein Tsubulata_007740 [Turnera subulata]|uniref:Thioredoxin domain-containing protein n=1 Tax=Turnera subulata TaxID=218843 RepID=A0A9Q0J2I1_9ROSI|nr:hypothetical protein Tsubulata_007740 [Turnera subulata]
MTTRVIPPSRKQTDGYGSKATRPVTTIFFLLRAKQKPLITSAVNHQPKLWRRLLSPQSSRLNLCNPALTPFIAIPKPISSTYPPQLTRIHQSNPRPTAKPASPSLPSPVLLARVEASGLAGGVETPDLLETVKVFDLNGNPVPISDLWKDRKAVVAFARHFGCVFCRKRADYLAAKKDVMDASGVALVIIGPGSVDQMEYVINLNIFIYWLVATEVYADPSHSSYEALKFVSGVTTTFTPKAGLKIIELYMEGYRQDWKLSFEKDTVNRGGWQQGGIIVAGPGKTNISYIHKDKEAGDDPDIEGILQACCS